MPDVHVSSSDLPELLYVRAPGISAAVMYVVRSVYLPTVAIPGMVPGAREDPDPEVWIEKY